MLAIILVSACSILLLSSIIALITGINNFGHRKLEWVVYSLSFLGSGYLYFWLFKPDGLHFQMSVTPAPGELSVVSSNYLAAASYLAVGIFIGHLLSNRLGDPFYLESEDWIERACRRLTVIFALLLVLAILFYLSLRPFP